MPTTRAMAREASSMPEDKENEPVPSLRKKPVRRPGPKTTQTARGRKAAASNLSPSSANPTEDRQQHMTPLSPKKNVQLPQTRSRLRVDKAKDVAEIGTARPRRRQTHQKMQAQDPDHGPSDQGEPRTRNIPPRATRAGAVQNQISGRNPCPSQLSTATEPRAKKGSQPKGAPEPHSFTPVARQRRRQIKSSSENREHYHDRAAISSSQGTPMPRLVPKLVHHKEPTSPASPSDLVVKGQHEDISDDEICGPNTPLQRAKTFACTSNSKHTAKTPRGKMLVYRSNEDYFSHTQKVPLKPAAENNSPRRPMSVARGSSVAYVFHPLPKALRANSPLKGPYQWPVTPSDDCSDANDDNVSVASSRRSRPTTPGLRRAQTSERTSEARDRLISLFVSDPADDDDDDDEDEDHDNDEEEGSEDETRFPILGSERNDKNANAEYIPEDADASDDHDDSLSTTLENSPDCSVCDKDESDLVDESAEVMELMPELHSEFMQSTPTQTAPELLHQHLASPLASDDELGETPTLTRGTDLFASVRRPAPRPRVSFVLDHEEASIHTPTASRRSGTTPFKTPRMHTALDEFDEIETSAHTMAEPHGASQGAGCIDPSLLAHHAIGPSSPRKDSVQTEFLVANVANNTTPKFQQCEISSSPLSSPAKSPTKQADDERTARLSLLLHTDDLIQTPGEKGNSWFDGADAIVETNPSPKNAYVLSPLASQVAAGALPESEDSSTLDHSVIHHDVAPYQGYPNARMTELFEESTLEEDQSDTPHYALPTVSYDARRRSMPVLVAKTPQNDTRMRMAETAVKRSSATPFAQAWLERMPQVSNSPSRRQSLISLASTTPRHHSQSCGLPRSVSSMGLRAKSSLPQLRKSIGGYETAPTPVQTVTTPRPRCYTPSVHFSNIKLASTRVQTPCSPPKISSSPKKMVTLSPRKACTSPKKTPMRPATAASVAFTPHPKAPLSGVVAFVDVFTRSGLDASASFVAALQRLGARTTKSLGDKVTHIVFKDGSPTTLSKVRVARKDGQQVAIVNSRWVTDCDHQGVRMDELAEEYHVEVEGSTPSVAMPRRRKSMEPHALAKDTDAGKKGATRLSVASSVWAESPIKSAEWDRTEFSDDEEEWFDDTPVQRQGEWRRTPGSVPVQRMMKLDLGGGAGRRLTAWEERE